jgi:hypothetical protein
MIAADALTASLADLTQLLCVRRMRLDAVQRRFAVLVVGVDKAEAALQRAHDQKVQAEQALLDYRHRLAGEAAAELVAMGSMGRHFQARLGHAISTAQTDIERATAAREEAHKALQECRRALRREQARHDAIEAAQRRARVAQVRAAQVHEEEELGETHRPSTGVPHAHRLGSSEGG